MAVLRQATALASGAAASYVAYQLSRGDEGRRSLLLGLARADASVRPVLAAVLPHDAFVCLYSASRTPFLHALGSCSAGDGGHLAGSSPVRVMGLSFRNDLGNAAGLDKDATLLDLNYGLGAGFAVVGTVLSEEHTGNVENMLGGVDVTLSNIAAFRKRHGLEPQTADRKINRGDGASGSGSAGSFPIGVSIMGHPRHGSEPSKKLDGVVECVRKALPLADFIEINESCPNVAHGGGSKAGNAELGARLGAVVKARDAELKRTGRRVPLLVKLGDLGASPKETVRFLSKLGIDGVVALNTQKDYAAFDLPPADAQLLEFYTGRYGGGLSGAPILARSTSQVRAAQAAVQELKLGGRFTVIHVGGLQSHADVLSSRATGAELRQWYTGLMHGLAQPEPLTLYARLTARD